MSERRIIIDTSFNEMRYDPKRLSQEWIDYRMKIFMLYTLKSLKQQTNQNFLQLLKYDPQSEEQIQKSLSQYDKLPANIRFVRYSDEYKQEFINYIQGSRQFYLTRLDSDNLYQHEFIEQLHQYQPNENTEVLINQHGYIYDVTSKRLAHFYHFSPSFYSLIYNTDDYLNGKRYTFRSHRNAIKLKHELLPAGNFMVLVHNNNVLYVFDISTRKKIIDDPQEISEVLKRFLG